MIIKEYSQNINIHKPRNYFEKWYAAVWRKHIAHSSAPPSMVDNAMMEELAQYHARFCYDDDGNKLVVTFENDADYTLFALRWS